MRSKVTIFAQLPARRSVGTNRHAWRLTPTLEQRAAVRLRHTPAEVGRQGNRDIVLRRSRWCLKVEESAEHLVGLLRI